MTSSTAKIASTPVTGVKLEQVGPFPLWTVRQARRTVSRLTA